MRVAAMLVLAAIVLTSAAIVFRRPKDYGEQDREQVSIGSSPQHWMGTDDLGRDRTIRTSAALLLGLCGASMAATMASFLAVGVGVAAAFAKPWVGKSLVYLADLALTLPWIFMLMIVRAALPLTLSPMRSALLTFLLLAILGAPVFVRINYARAKAVRRAGWLLQSRAAGLDELQLIRHHIFPHVRPLFVTQLLTFIPVCLIAEANLGAMGLGVSAPLPSWGAMLQELQNSAFTATSHWVYVPVTLMIVVLFALETVMFKEDA